MHTILTDILSLKQHLETLFQNPENYRAKCCPACGCGKNSLWSHGCYYRKPDRSPEGSQNPIPIPRFICQNCRKTHSVLPECIPPRRWYPWLVQQAILTGFLANKSLRFMNKTLEPARSTCRRWWRSLKANFLNHAAALKALISDLGRYPHFEDFWQACLKLMSLGKAMHLCHEQGVQIP